MAESIISISDSDDEDVVPSTSASASSTSRNNPSPSTKPPPSLEFSLLSSAMSSFNISTQSSYDSASGLAAMFKPLGADLLEARQLQAMKKKRMAILTPFPVVRDVVTKLRLLLGIHESKRNVLGIAQDYITSLKFYQRQIMNCPNRCRLLARHITMTMCLIRDLSRHLFDSPHYSQKISELLGLYIFFELHCATDFKDSKVKIAERIISNIHLHLQNAKANFVLRIFAFLDNMCKQGEIATKVFQRLIPEPIVMVKNELPDRLFIQYLIVFYHWKEAWNDYEDQQKVVAFANKFMKPMNTIKSNDIYSKHLPSYIKRDDAAGYFLSNLVFFNDLRTASILDGVLDNGIIDLCDDEKVYPILDLSQTIFEPVQPLVQNIKVEPREMDGTVDLTEDDDETWLNKLIRRAVALEVILPPRLLARNEDQAPAVIELSDSDNENEEENGNDDDWAFGPRNDQQPQLEEEQPQIEGEQQQPAAEPENPQVNQEDTDSLNDLFNELNSSLDFGDESTTESEKGRRKIQKERYEYAVKLTDAQVRLTFDGVVEKELRAMVVQGQAVAAEAVPVEAASDGPSTSTAAASARSVSEKTDPVSNSDDQPTISKTAPVSKNLISSKAAAATEKPASTEMVVESTKNTSASSSMLTEPSEKSNSSKVPDAVIEEPEIISEPAASISHQDDENEEPSIFTSDIIEEVQSNPVRNDQEISTESAALVVEQPEAQSANVDPTTDHDQTLSTILQQIQSPRDAITYTMDTLLSSFDSSDESDEDFIGRFQKPPFKTYLRRAHKRLSKREKAIGNFSTGSSEENDATNVEAKKLSSLNENENNNKQQTLSPPILPLSSDTTTNTENPNVLFSGKVISLREDDGAGGVTPNYLKSPESVEVSKHGSNVVFSMQGRRLSSFPSLKVTSNDNTMPDFDEEIAMTGGEDSNSRTDDITFRKKAFKKSSIANAKKAKSAQGADKHRSKAKSVWFAENPQVREIESRKSTPSPQKSTSAINVISSTINKISANKQHFTSKILSTPSTSTTTQPTTLTTLINKTKSNFFDTNKFTKSNHLIQNRSNPITTESSAITAALKSAQEKDLLQKLFPEAFPQASTKQPERKNNNNAPKTPALIKAAISSSYNLNTANNANKSHEINYRRVSVTSVSTAAMADTIINNKGESRRKSISTSSDKQMPSDFDKYLVRKKLLKPSKLAAAAAGSSAVTPKTNKNAIPKTDKPKTKQQQQRPRKSAKTLALIANDPKLGNQMKPIVLLNRVEGPVFILRSGMSNQTFTEISPGVYKLKQSPLPSPTPQSASVGAAEPLITPARQIPAIRTKSLSDILSDVVVQEMTATVPKGKDNPRNESISDAILTDASVVVVVEKQKQKQQHDVSPLPSIVAVTVLDKLPLEEKEKEEDGKTEEETVQPKIVPLSSNNASVKSQDEMELKLIKKEEMEAKSPSLDMIPSKPVSSDCFKKPLKSMAQKRSIMHNTSKCTSPTAPIGQESPRSSLTLEAVASSIRHEIQEPVTSSTNNHLFPPLTSESESDSSCRTEQIGDRESSELSDSSQSLSPRKSLKVRLRRCPVGQKQQLLESSTVSKSIMDEMKSKASDGARKRRARKSLEKKGVEHVEKIFESADSSTSSAPPPMNLDQQQQPPQSGLINGVLVPSIEAMNTPPPTPPTTVDDKSSVADDTSQEAKSQTASEASNIHNPSPHPPVVIFENGGENGSNVHILSSNVDLPPIEIGENLQAHANQVLNFRSAAPGQRRRFESVSLPSTNKKRPRKKSTTTMEASDSDDMPAKDTSRSHLKKRRKTICTDVFNPPNISSDEEICSTKAAADSRTFIFEWGSKVSMALSKDRQDDESSSVRLNIEENSPSSNDLCDSSRLSPINPPDASSTLKSNSADQIEIDGSPCRSRPNCDSPVAKTRNLAKSKCSLKSQLTLVVSTKCQHPITWSQHQQPTSVLDNNNDVAIKRKVLERKSQSQPTKKKMMTTEETRTIKKSRGRPRKGKEKKVQFEADPERNS
ncbi:mucin-2-like isoform X2 [Episyrphus balteatus]|uniref:mucin-2-like isoform X2 n=1 Tax=Episyrphus balteatus TaxID=286459 RepID=UPI002486257F|nr:mucin-2-like isoform X2 [Episyrphus balteatus]